MKRLLSWIVGVIVIVGVITAGAAWVGMQALNRMAEGEMEQLMANTRVESQPITESDLADLPTAVQQWLRQAQVIGQYPIQAIRLTQQASLRLSPEQPWVSAQAEQAFRVKDPAFVWKANIKMNPLMAVVGRDKYVNGRGEMLIKILGLLPVVDARGPEMDQGTMLRYLAEMTWFPTAALSSYLTWEHLDDTHAKATMTYGGQSVSGVFAFRENGQVQSFTAQRYKEAQGKFTLENWIVEMVDYKEFNGLIIPHKANVIWDLDSGPYHWFSCELVSVDYIY
ncbi:MAG: hypothetical protein GX195_09405 [Firmicutes bacterium]|nr:hypothetical protein [Bacillota bacterium]